MSKGTDLSEVALHTQPSLRLLGEIALLRDGAFVALPPSKKTRALLAYLAATAKPHRRDRLCDLFWDIPDDPRGSLRWSLSRLRSVLDDDSCARIQADRENVALATPSLTIDLHLVEQVLARADGPVAELKAAADLFTGDFAAGLDLPGCEDFQVWLMTQREAVRRLHLNLLKRVVEMLPAAEAVPYAQRRLEIDSDIAEHHTTLLSLLMAVGRRREAEQQASLSLARLKQIDATAAEILAAHWRKLQHAAQAAVAETAPVAVPAVAGDGDKDAEWSEERKQVTILHVNLRESSLIDDPEIAAGRLAPLLTRLDMAIRRYGGTIMQRRSDGATALFGAPIACQNHAARACLAALAIQDGCVDSKFGIALHAAEVMIRSQGDRIEAFGPALRIVEEIERVTPARHIYLGHQTYRLVEGMFQVEASGGLSLPGLAEPIELLTLVSQTGMAGSWYARVIRGLTAFVGRQHDLDALVRIAGKVKGGGGQVAVVVGEPGLGKSRLLHELIQAPELSPAIWRRLEGGATPYDHDTPYFLIGRLLRNWLQLGGRPTEAETRARLDTALNELDPSLHWAAPALGVPLDLPGDAAWNTLDAAIRRRQVSDAVDAVVNALALRQPLLLLVEDVHWADADSAAIVETLVSRLGRRRIYLVVTARPEAAPSWLSRSVCHPVRLDSLDRQAAEEMAAALLGDDPSLLDFKRRLVEWTGGTPLFLEEAVNALIETGALIGRRGAYRLVRADDELRLPPTVQAVLGERIDRLPKPLKLLLQVSAVIGEDLPLDILTPLMELPDDVLARQLDALQEAEFLYETSPNAQRHFAFKHALTRDVAYASLLVAQRRKLHRRALKIILVKLRRRGEDMIERLAHHAVHAEKWSLAVKFLCAAGDKSVRRSAFREAVRFYEAALQALSHLPQTPMARLYSAILRLRLRPPLGAIAAFTQAFEHLQVAEGIVEDLGDVRRMIAIAIHKSYILSSQGRIDAAIVAAERACTLAEQAGDSLSHLEASLSLGQAHAFRGDVAKALAIVSPLRQRLTTELRYERLGQTGLRSVWCLMHLADALTLKGDLKEARAVTQEAIEIADEVNKPYDRAVAHLRDGFIELQAGNPHKAVAAFDRSRSLAEGSDLVWVAAWARTGLGYAYVLSGHSEAGLHLLEATRRQAAASEFISVEAMSSVYLADSRRRCGQLREGVADAESALAASRQWGYWDIEVLALMCLARVGLDRRDADPVVLATLRDVAKLCEQRGYRLLQAEAAQLMAPLLEQAGDRQAAAAATSLADRLLRELP